MQTLFSKNTMRKMVVNPPEEKGQRIWMLNDHLPFGVHVGKTIEWCIENHPGYIEYLQRQHNLFLHKKVKDAIRKFYLEAQ